MKKKYQDKNIMEIFKIRSRVIELSYKSKSAHLGSSLSCVEIIYSILKKKISNFSDIIISKGHASMAYLACLENFKYIKKINSSSYLKKNSKFWGHISKKKNSRFLKFSFGSLGYGLGIASGLAYDNYIKRREDKIYCLISDGELNEGSTWESIFFVKHHKLRNLKIIVDDNKIQSFGFCKYILDINYKKTLKKLGFKVYSINGHNYKVITKIIHKNEKEPTIVFCNTVKGKGLKKIENTISSHYIPATKESLVSYEN